MQLSINFLTEEDKKGRRRLKTERKIEILICFSFCRFGFER